MNKNLNPNQKSKRSQYYVLDLDWLLIEAREIYGWKNIRFRKLVELLLFKNPEDYLDAVNSEWLTWLHINNFEEPIEGAVERLWGYWIEKRAEILSRLEYLLDMNDISERFLYYNWLPCNHLILKRKDECYIPPPDHLVSGRL